MIFILTFILLAFLSAPLFVWIVLTLGLLVYLQAGLVSFALLLFFAVFIAVRFIRRAILSRLLMKIIQKWNLFPRISETEKTALSAGEVWVEREFFSGRADFKKIFEHPEVKLSAKEESFLNHETEILCSMIDDWKVHKTRRLPKEVDEYIRKNKFLGMTIPESYGGLGFSHAAHSRVLEKICSHSYAAGIYIMVPNSLGPGELLVQYGSQKQKDEYLPRLADGREIPCFGLTEPRAGSDAASIESKGRLFKDEKGELKIRLNWNKRWITLAPVSTLLGLAFQLEDPDEILGRGKSIGITCALVPTSIPGVEIGDRHDPMGIAFPNGPTWGHNVVISADNIIGGIEQAGRGWEMLMECLGTGRGVSLPSSSLASCKLVLRSTSCHSVVRRQFGLSIGKFEGVQEVLADMGGLTFLSQSVLDYTLSALGQGVPSSLCSAMAKYQVTEMGRKTTSMAMDIMGGAGLSLGPNNLTALCYIVSPIAITVEGANILTRSFIIFGQGLIRAHPFVYKEIKALDENNLFQFDRYFWIHAGHIVKNIIRLIALSLTRGVFIIAPFKSWMGLRNWQKTAWAGCFFSVLAEIAMIGLGGKLKIKERLTGRFADALMGLYMSSAVLWKWRTGGRKKSMRVFFQWSLQHSLYLVQKSFEGILRHFEFPLFSFVFRHILFHLIRLNPIAFKPSDKLSSRAGQALISNFEVLDELTTGIYLSQNKNSRMKKLESGYKLSLLARPIEKKIKKGVKEGKIKKDKLVRMKDAALEKNIITVEEHKAITELEDLRWQAIQVDSFTEENYF